MAANLLVTIILSYTFATLSYYFAYRRRKTTIDRLSYTVLRSNVTASKDPIYVLLICGVFISLSTVTLTSIALLYNGSFALGICNSLICLTIISILLGSKKGKKNNV